MNKLFLSLSVLLCLVHRESIAQGPGAVRWNLLIDLSPTDDSIRSIKVQSDGKIVAAGDSAGGVIAIGRFDGTRRDSSFGINGIVTTRLDSAYTKANALELQPDGKIVVAGGYYKGAARDFILARYKPNGSADSSFGINGIVRTDIASGSVDVATALAIQTDGRIVAAGWSGSSLALCRYNANGSLDSTFDSDGKRTVAAAGATCMNLQTDGKMVICCGSVVIRLMPDGSLDYGFGTAAVAALTGYFYGMAIQKDGKILVAGSKFTLERLDTTGLPDNSFGIRGVVTTPAIYPGSNANQLATSVCIQADGRILASGKASGGLSGNSWFALARYQTNGAPDSSFGTLGTVWAYNSFNPHASYIAVSQSSAINNNNELVLAGTNFDDINGNFQTEWALASYYLGPMLGVPAVPGICGQIIVAPNPAEDFARIQAMQVENGTWHLSLCDLMGRTLYSEKVVVTNNALEKSISLVGLSAAMYLVKLDDGISRMAVKLAKNR